VTLKGQARDRNSLKAQYLENYLSYRLQIWYTALYAECRGGAQKISPKSGRGLSHVMPKIFAYDRTYLQNYLSYRLQIWYTALYGALQAGAQKFPLKVGVA